MPFSLSSFSLLWQPLATLWSLMSAHLCTPILRERPSTVYQALLMKCHQCRGLVLSPPLTVISLTWVTPEAASYQWLSCLQGQMTPRVGPVPAPELQQSRGSSPSLPDSSKEPVSCPFVFSLHPWSSLHFFICLLVFMYFSLWT